MTTDRPSAPVSNEETLLGYLAGTLRQHREGLPYDEWDWAKCSDRDFEFAGHILEAMVYRRAWLNGIAKEGNA